MLVLKNCAYHKTRCGCAELVTQSPERGRILGKGQSSVKWKKVNFRVWSGLLWFRVRTSNELL